MQFGGLRACATAVLSWKYASVKINMSADFTEKGFIKVQQCVVQPCTSKLADSDQLVKSPSSWKALLKPLWSFSVCFSVVCVPHRSREVISAKKNML